MQKLNSKTLTGLTKLFLTLSCVTLLGCSTTRITGFASRNDAGIPRICSKSWMQPIQYADDGIEGQVIGEDTKETVDQARRNNAGQGEYCHRKSPQSAGPQ